jgi:hypothetical protein
VSVDNLTDNKEKIKQRKKNYYLANKERIRSQQKEYRLANKDKLRDYHKKYNKERCLNKNEKELLYHLYNLLDEVESDFEEAQKLANEKTQ